MTKKSSAWWGLGVEHEFLVQNSDTGALLTPEEALGKQTRGGYLLRVTAPAGGRISQKKLLAHARHYCKLVIERTNDAAATYPSIDEVDNMGLEDILELLKDWLRMFSNDAIYTYSWWGDVHSLPALLGCSGACRRLKPEEAMRTYAALRELVLKKKMSRSTTTTTEAVDHDIDGPFIETRSTEFKNATVEDVVTQLHNAEATVLGKARKNGFKNVRIYPWSGNVNEKGDGQYLGSYHVWITLPTVKAPKMTMKHRSDILLKHGCLTHLLQWIEPLLMTLFTGDPRALGSADDKFVRASMRARYSNYSGYGTTRASSIVGDRDIDDAKYIRWYETEEDLLLKRNSHHQRSVSWPLYVWVDGVKVQYQQCMAGQRTFDWHGDVAGFQPVVGNLNTMYMASGPGGGADIRSELCSSLGIKLNRSYTERWLRVKDTLELRFVNNKTNKLTRDVPIEDKSWGKEMRGIEFRAIDNMPPAQIDELLHLLVLVAAASLAKCSNERPDFEKNAAALSPHWNKALQDVRRLGAHAPVNCGYISKLASELGVHIKCGAGGTMFDALLALSGSLHSAFKDSETVRMMHPGSSEAGPPAFDNVGQMAWQEAWDAADAKMRKKASRNPRNAPYIERMQGAR